MGGREREREIHASYLCLTVDTFESRCLIMDNHGFNFSELGELSELVWSNYYQYASLSSNVSKESEFDQDI